MKKFITIAVATAILAAATAILANRNTDPIFQANIEALMNQEGSPGSGVCYNAIKAQPNSSVLFCGTCTFIENSTVAPFSGIGQCQ